MNEALQVTFRHMTTSPAIRELAEQKLQKLRQQFPDATSCHVILDAPGATHHRKGIEFRAQLELTGLLVADRCRVPGPGWWSPPQRSRSC